MVLLYNLVNEFKKLLHIFSICENNKLLATMYKFSQIRFAKYVECKTHRISIRRIYNSPNANNHKNNHSKNSDSLNGRFIEWTIRRVILTKVDIFKICNIIYNWIALNSILITMITPYRSQMTSTFVWLHAKSFYIILVSLIVKCVYVQPVN